LIPSLTCIPLRSGRGGVWRQVPIGSSLYQPPSRPLLSPSTRREKHAIQRFSAHRANVYAPGALLLVMARRDSTVERREALFEEAVAIIERDYPRQIDLNTVAAEIATSRRQLQRAFAEVGRT